MAAQPRLLTPFASEDIPPDLDGAVVELTWLDRQTVTAEIRIPGPAAR